MWAQPNDRKLRTLSQCLTAVIAEGMNIQANKRVENTEWAKSEKFLGKIPTLPCEDARKAAEEARRHADAS